MQRHQCTLRCLVTQTRLAGAGHTHKTFVGDIGGALQMEEDGHVILVVSSIETSDIDRRAAKAITKVLRVQRGFPIVSNQVCVPLRIGSFYRSNFLSHRLWHERQDPRKDKWQQEP